MGNGRQHCQVILIQSDCLETDNLLTEPRAFLPDRRIRVRVFQAVTKQARCSSRRNARTLLSFSPHLPALTIQADIFFQTEQRQGWAKDSWKKINVGTNRPFPWKRTFIDAAHSPRHSRVFGPTFQCQAFPG